MPELARVVGLRRGHGWAGGAPPCPRGRRRPRLPAAPGRASGCSSAPTARACRTAPDCPRSRSPGPAAAARCRRSRPRCGAAPCRRPRRAPSAWSPRCRSCLRSHSAFILPLLVSSKTDRNVTVRVVRLFQKIIQLDKRSDRSANKIGRAHIEPTSVLPDPVPCRRMRIYNPL